MNFIIKHIIHFLYSILEIVEKIENRKLILDESDITKKILRTNLLDIFVNSDTSYVPANSIHITQPYKVYKLKLKNGLSLECADNHIVYRYDMVQVFVADIRINDLIYTELGYSEVIEISKLPYKLSMFDLSIDSDNHRYFTNKILSHNTINASITILYYCVFERNKNILMGGNIAATSEEILNKIKDIYYNLPFWLKPTTLVWNVKQVTFGDTKCRIKAVGITKTAGIGNTIDLLYLDEFAHVQSNIADDFYRSIYPTVSAIQNSKIIITSTPNGYNLFWKLLNGAEKVIGDKDKNPYVAKRVYWYQVPGRFVTYLRLNVFEMEKHNLNPEKFYDYIKNTYHFEEEVLDARGFTAKEGLKMVINYERDGQLEIHIPNKDSYLPLDIKNILNDKEWENPLSDFFRSLTIIHEDRNIKLLDICEVSSWKEDTILSIGGLDAFLQEYELQFLSGAKMVLDSSIMSKIENSIVLFKHLDIPILNTKSFVDYSKLEWSTDETKFNMADIKKYYLMFSVDISEGLNGDFSVINIFRTLPKREDELNINITSITDFFKVSQVGLFHSNTTSVQELAELLYFLLFVIADPDKVGCVIESNNWGGELIKTMREMFNGRNDYGSNVFFRYKHRQDAIKPEIGIKLRQNKNLFVKDYQKRIKTGDITIHHQATLHEMTKFIKKESAMGYTFSAETGSNDDIVMTVVELATIFDNNLFKDIVNRILSEQDQTFKNFVDQKMKLAPSMEATDYNALFNAQRKANYARNIQMQNRNNGNKNGFSSGSGWDLLGRR